MLINSKLSMTAE